MEKILYSFRNDYSEGAHIKILEALVKTNFQQADGYGEDRYCIDAVKLIKAKLENEDVDIHFTTGGTQANLIMISSGLKPYESVISACTGHINVHEAGSIEAKGHKINLINTENGKLSACQIKKVLDEHTDEHMVKPKMVYISNSTEIGTVYNKKELKELSEFCKNNKLYLFMDGARLGSALMSDKSDLNFSDLPNLTDAFYIGGTKNGALIGEAIVLCNDELKENFRFYLKQNGALLAKGRILGIQFLELFQDDLFFKNAQHANDMANKLSQAIETKGYSFISTPSSNQIFPILPNRIIDILSKKYLFHIWSNVNEEMSAIRLVTSWATPIEIVEEFIQDFKAC